MPLRMVELNLHAMLSLLSGDLSGAGAAAGVRLTDYFIGAESVRLWRVRVDQVRRDPASAAWIAQAALDEESGQVVGHAGFHGPPDEVGLVEIGYAVDPRFRRRGYARRMVAELLHRAAAEPGVRTVRASIRPDNLGSLAVIARFNFVQVGEQWDETDGRELRFERPV